MAGTSRSTTLERIREALKEAARAISTFVPGSVTADNKAFGKGPVTEADRISNRVLREALVRDGEGWLSEESADNPERLKKQRVWIVDPLDGTIEFVAGIPEWCISVALVEDNRAVAGGICNPATGELFIGLVGGGITYNDCPVRASDRSKLAGAIVLASRSEVKRGEWKRFQSNAFEVRPTGSVAYKLALVAAGLADATWTLTPKNEWDVAAGVALVEAGGGHVRSPEGLPCAFNNECSRLPGLVACGPHLHHEIEALLGLGTPTDLAINTRQE